MLKYLKDIDVNKAAGIDNRYERLLKDCADMF